MTQTLTQIAHDGKSLNKLVTTTINSYTKVAKQLHATACAVFFHAAQYGDATALNTFHKGLRVNDKTALRVWIGLHSSFVDLENGSTRNWIKYSEKEGFRIVKGTESFRKDMFSVEEENGEKTILINLAPFYEKNVKDKDAITLEALLAMLGKAAERVTKQANNEGIKLPADVLTLTTSIKNTVTKEQEALARVKE